MKNETEKKWVLVTGGAKRVGAEIVLQLAQDGYNIYLHFRSSRAEAEEIKKKAENYGAKVVLVSGDLSEKEDVEKIFKEISSLPLHAVIHNAGEFLTSKPEGSSAIEILEAEEIAFSKNMAINAFGPLLLTRIALERMKQDSKQDGEGRSFIFIGDAAIHSTGGDAYGDNLMAYIMSKAYIPPLVKHLSKCFGRDGIYFHGILNGAILPPPKASQETIDKVAKTINVPAKSLNPWLGPKLVAMWVSFYLKAGHGANGSIAEVDGARGGITPPEH